ncbi:MAG: ABC transporter ATP-binding protein [Christensenellaceae bacterium]|jgi:ATP-binding cassette subfamily B multidrug efflux pump
MNKNRKNTSPADKKKSFGNTAKRLLSYFGPYKKKVIFMLACAVVSVVLAIMGPRILGTATNLITLRAQFNETGMLDLDNVGNVPAIDKLHEVIDESGHYVGPPIEDTQMPMLKLTLGVLVIIYGLSALFSYLQQKTTAQVSQKTVHDLRQAVSEKIQRLPLNYYDTHTRGEILSRTTTDIEQISTTIQQMLTQFITAIFTIIGIVIMMFTISWQMALIALCVLPAALLLCSLLVRKSQKYFLGQQNELGDVNSYVEEYYAGHNVVKLFRVEKRVEKEFDGMNERLKGNARRAQFSSSIMMPVTNLVGNIGYVGVCIFGGMLTLNGGLTIGAIQSFIQYMQQFTQPIVQTTNIINLLQSTIAASDRVFELLDEAEQSPEKQSLIQPGKTQGNITFEHVKFGYSPDKILITDMNVEVKAGQKVGICGPTGAGKTTMINLLMRFYDLNGGVIKIDGTDATDMTRQDVRRQFGMVLQDTWLYSASIRDNIRYGRPEATDEEVEDACKMANAHHFISMLPDGYDTLIDESAGNLSSGQKQLLTIARAFCANPQILILDEATSSVDTRTEKLMVDAMKKLTQGRTNFQIAHRLSTIFDADLILVLKDGDLVEQGTHSQLMDMDGVYAALYNSQFA